MEESKQNLQDALRDLHGALETAQDLDEHDRGELASAIEQMRVALGRLLLARHDLLLKMLGLLISCQQQPLAFLRIVG